jgi:transcriptional regulator with XRE-family HTH domain
MPAEDKSFPQRLQAFRTAAGLSQLQLGERAGVSNKMVSHWERGVSEPSLSHLASLASALERTAGELLGLEPPGQPRMPPWLKDTVIMLKLMDFKDFTAVSEVIKAFVMKKSYLDERKQQEARRKAKEDADDRTST